jgi:integrase
MMRYILQSFIRGTGIEYPGQITRGLVEGWLEKVRSCGKHADTLNRYGRVLKTFVDYCTKNKLLSPAVQFEVPEAGLHGRKTWLRKDEVRAIIDQCADDNLTFVLYCGFHTGLRRNEISNARVGWFDLDAGLLHVQNDVSSGFILKDRENRSIPLSRPFQEFLRDFLAGKEAMDYATHPQKSQGLWRYRYDFSRAWNTHMRRCGVKCSIHDARRSFASNLVSQGESIYIVAKWLGDGIPVVERSYGHLAPSAGNINRLT